MFLDIISESKGTYLRNVFVDTSADSWVIYQILACLGSLPLRDSGLGSCLLRFHAQPSPATPLQHSALGGPHLTWLSANTGQLPVAPPCLPTLPCFFPATLVPSALSPPPGSKTPSTQTQVLPFLLPSTLRDGKVLTFAVCGVWRSPRESFHSQLQK